MRLSPTTPTLVVPLFFLSSCLVIASATPGHPIVEISARDTVPHCRGDAFYNEITQRCGPDPEDFEPDVPAPSRPQDSGPDEEPHVEPDNHPDNNPDDKPDDRPEDEEPHAEPDNNPDNNTDDKPEEKSHAEPDNEPVDKPVDKPHAKPHAKPDGKPHQEPHKPVPSKGLTRHWRKEKYFEYF